MYLDDDNLENSTKTPKLPKTLFISEGNKYLRGLKLDKAISSFEKILDEDPNNIMSLLGRAKCFMRLGRYKEAWNDFQIITKQKPKCTEAVYLKGVTEYLKGDFEKSYITYRDGYRVRPGCDELRQGYELCRKAIENNLNADKRMLLTEKDTNKIAHVHGENLRMEDDLGPKDDFYKKGLFSTDLKLLHDMLKDKNLATYHSLYRDVFDYLRERQKFWKIYEPVKSGIKSSYNMAFVKNNIFDLKKMTRLVRNFGLCKMAFKEGKPEICIKKGIEILKSLTTLSPEKFPGKNEMETETLHCVGMSCLEEGDISSAYKCCELQLNIVTDENLLQSKERALRDLGEVYHKDLKFSSALQLYEEGLPFAQTENSKAIILYKISDCNIHLNNLENARKAANQCLEFATRYQNSRFQFDALLLLGEVAVKGKYMDIAEEYYTKALEVAVNNKDPRQKDLKVLLEVFDEIAIKDSYSNERIKVMKYSDVIKRNTHFIRET